MGDFHRGRRLRSTPAMRRLVSETTFGAGDLVYPIFVTEGATAPISSMPGISRYSLSDLPAVLEHCAELRLGGVILFGIPEEKDAVGSGAYAEDGIIAKSLISAKKTIGDSLVLMADVCLCEYTDHGHCGLLDGEHVSNDPSLELLAKASVVYAQAGADVIAPSDMMDGRVRAIRDQLDAAGLENTPILSYAVKYASAFYGPFREAADSAPQFGDRRSYQMSPPNRREAVREALADLDEGADMVMVKPALPYLDIIRDVREVSDVPLGAYNVSGEYSMLKAAAANGWIDEDRAIFESLTSIRRAGADFILTYHAVEAAERTLWESVV
ncbi:MAG: porphobilinogen synthase [Chthonomonadales bacterium]